MTIYIYKAEVHLYVSWVIFVQFILACRPNSNNAGRPFWPTHAGWGSVSHFPTAAVIEHLLALSAFTVYGNTLVPNLGVN